MVIYSYLGDLETPYGYLAHLAEKSAMLYLGTVVIEDEQWWKLDQNVKTKNKTKTNSATARMHNRKKQESRAIAKMTARCAL